MEFSSNEKEIFKYIFSNRINLWLFIRWFRRFLFRPFLHFENGFLLCGLFENGFLYFRQSNSFHKGAISPPILLPLPPFCWHVFIIIAVTSSMHRDSSLRSEWRPRQEGSTACGVFPRPNDTHAAPPPVISTEVEKSHSFMVQAALGREISRLRVSIESKHIYPHSGTQPRSRWQIQRAALSSYRRLLKNR